MRTLLIGLLLLAHSVAFAEPIVKDRLLVVVGIAKEAQLVKGDNTTLVISGANSAHLEEILQNLDPTGIRAVISTGVAGGLNPIYRPGDVIVASSVIKEGQVWPTDSVLSAQFIGELLGADIHAFGDVIFGSDTVIFTPAGKQDIFRTTKAGAVDMESHVAAAWAKKHGLPFAAVRVVSDPAERTLPSVTNNSITLDGEIRNWSIIGRVVLRPWQFPRLIRAGFDSWKAFGVLAKCKALLEPTPIQPAE